MRTIFELYIDVVNKIGPYIILKDDYDRKVIKAWIEAIF